MIDSRILIGLIAILISLASVVYVGINEADRQARFKKAFAGRNIETGAILFEESCSSCHGIKGQGIQGVAPGLNTPEFFSNRLAELGYAGSLKAYVKLTVAGGRPVKSDNTWPQNMPTWSQDFGGPLRNDQVDSVVAYIMSWEEQYDETGGPLPTPTPLACDAPEECGALLFQNLGCIGCHTINGAGGAVGPELTNVYGDNGEDYVRQSIVNPNAVISEGFTENLMPQTFGQTLSDADLNSIIAYLASVSE